MFEELEMFTIEERSFNDVKLLWESGLDFPVPAAHVQEQTLEPIFGN